MEQAKKPTSAVMPRVGARLAGLMVLTAGLWAPWAAAQTEPNPPAPKATPQLTVPLPNRINRNPAYRAGLPQEPPPPVDPRDSTVRPVTPPGSSDGRDTVLSAPGQAPLPGNAASAPRKP